MDEPDFRSLLAGTGCTACGASIPGDSVRVLAQRELLTFIELRCPACGSETLAMAILETDDPGGVPVIDVAGYGEFGPADDARLGAGPPIGQADVEAMRSFLAEHRGDLRSLVEGRGA
jgi:hypothetical protein